MKYTQILTVLFYKLEFSCDSGAHWCMWDSFDPKLNMNNVFKYLNSFLSSPLEF